MWRERSSTSFRGVMPARGADMGCRPSLDGYPYLVDRLRFRRLRQAERIDEPNKSEREGHRGGRE